MKVVFMNINALFRREFPFCTVQVPVRGFSPATDPSGTNQRPDEVIVTSSGTNQRLDAVPVTSSGRLKRPIDLDRIWSSCRGRCRIGSKGRGRGHSLFHVSVPLLTRCACLQSETDTVARTLTCTAMATRSIHGFSCCSCCCCC